MDIDLARTFLAVVETGSFVEAANRVFVTQSTVSMRIKTLEGQLGKALFERDRSGATLTAAGTQFHKHALAMVRIWEQARLELSLPAGYQGAMTVGAQYSLWDGFLLTWLSRMRFRAPDIAFRTQLGTSSVLMQHLVEGTIDLGVMYTPESRPGLQVQPLFEEELIMVSTDPEPPARPGKRYMFIDWGPEFQAAHSLSYPDISTPGLYMELGSLSLRYLIDAGASGYVPRRLVDPHLRDGTLTTVPDAPVFHYPAYAVFPSESDSETLRLGIEIMRELAKIQNPPRQRNDASI